MFIKKIYSNKDLLGIIIYSEYQKDGIEFFTDDDCSQQIAYMKRETGYLIKPHIHNPVPRQVQYTMETLFIKKGKIRIDFYDNNKNYIESHNAKTGDVVFLASGGHGFKMLEETEIIEVKQGPFAGEKDKIRFVPIKDEEVKYER